MCTSARTCSEYRVVLPHLNRTGFTATPTKRQRNGYMMTSSRLYPVLGDMANT